MPGPLKGPVPPRFNAGTETNPLVVYKTPKLGKWQYFITAWFLFWWFGMAWRTLVRAWAGVWWVLRFALCCGLFHNSSCLTDKYLKAQRPLPLPLKTTKKTNRQKTSPWQTEWLHFIYWSKQRPRCNSQESREECVSMFSCRICKGKIRSKGTVPMLNICHGVWGTDFPHSACRERGRPKLQTWILVL